MSFNEVRLNYFASSYRFMNGLRSVNAPVVVLTRATIISK
jgi:hypothetical protein